MSTTCSCDTVVNQAEKDVPFIYPYIITTLYYITVYNMKCHVVDTLHAQQDTCIALQRKRQWTCTITITYSSGCMGWSRVQTRVQGLPVLTTLYSPSYTKTDPQMASFSTLRLVTRTGMPNCMLPTYSSRDSYMHRNAQLCIADLHQQKHKLFWVCF